MEKEMLSARLLAVCSLIAPCKTLVDVGSDHGKLSSYCLKNQICEYVIATDIHELPARRTKERLDEDGFSDKSEVLFSDGLTDVHLTSDMTVVIAGMGGLEICKILKDALKKEEGIPEGTSFVLQPQRSHYEVREFLSQQGFSIRNEKIMKEKGHWYSPLFAVYTKEKYALSEEEKHFGPVILKERPKEYGEYMTHQKRVMEKRALGDPVCREILENWEKLI